MRTEVSAQVRPLTAGFPAAITQANHIEPVPRRIRGVLDGEVVFDTTRAWYVWKWPYYPQYSFRSPTFAAGRSPVRVTVRRHGAARSSSTASAQARSFGPARRRSCASRSCPSCAKRSASIGQRSTRVVRGG